VAPLEGLGGLIAARPGAAPGDGQTPLGLPGDPRGNTGDVDRSAGIDLQHRTAKVQRTDATVQRRLQLTIKDVIDVTRVPGGRPLGKAAFDEGGRAAAEHLNGRRQTCSSAGPWSGWKLASTTAAGSSPTSASSTA
jgi:hypothetical protein